jgi:hypothetical protein
VAERSNAAVWKFRQRLSARAIVVLLGNMKATLIQAARSRAIRAGALSAGHESAEAAVERRYLDSASL